jgi:putative ABC transport system permease protein
LRLFDLLILPVASLWQQKLRTLLTTLGVVFGAFVLAASLSIGEGVQETIDRESHRSEISRRIEVFPRWINVEAEGTTGAVKVDGNMSEARRERIRRSLAEVQPRSIPMRVRVDLTRERLDKLAAIPNVRSVVPLVNNVGVAFLDKKSERVQVLSARPSDEACRRRIVAGRYFDSPDQHGVVVSELLAYRLGVVNEADAERLIGKSLRLEFRTRKVKSGSGANVMSLLQNMSPDRSAAIGKMVARLPDLLEILGLTKRQTASANPAIPVRPATPQVWSEEFTVVGVIRKSTADERRGTRDPLRVDTDVLLPYQTALDLYFRGIGEENPGVNLAVVLVDNEKDVKTVIIRVAELGLEARAALEFIERERLIYTLIFGGMTCVAGVALLVSALGIANTMLMSVLERTREIGIMKAVGADNTQLQFIFLVEGALIGVLGAGFGLLLAWAASYPGDAWVRSMVERDIKVNLKSAIFVFPPWMSVTVLLFTVVVTTLAALYPARHAARIDPVTALRHE